MLKRSRLSLGVVAAGAVVGAMFVPATSAFAVPNPAVVSVDDTSSNLLDGQTVHVSGSGFAPSSTVYLVQCSQLTGDPAHCDGASSPFLVTAPTDGSGAFTGVAFVVHVGATGDGTCDGASTTCGIAGSDSPLDPTSGDAGAAPITFAKVQAAPLTNLHVNDAVNFTGNGLPPSATVAILECGPDATAEGAGCDQSPSDVALTTTDGTGALVPIAFHVLTGEMQSGDAASTCPPGAGAALPCTLVAEQIDPVTFAPIATLGQLPISFAPVVKTTHVKTKTAAKSSAAKVKKHAKFTIAGTVKAGSKGVKALKVQLYERKSSKAKWSKVGKAGKTGSGGKFTFRLKGLGHTEQYQVKHPSQKVGTKIYDPSQSKTLTVKKK